VVGIGIFIIGRIQQRTLPENFAQGWVEPAKPLAAQSGARD
jgi:hypothetical protein